MNNYREGLVKSVTQLSHPAMTRDLAYENSLFFFTQNVAHNSAPTRLTLRNKFRHCIAHHNMPRDVKQPFVFEAFRVQFITWSEQYHTALHCPAYRQKLTSLAAHQRLPAWIWISKR